jgi:ABC-type transport system involved in multi-copper enzyme maturation permease subunit
LKSPGRLTRLAALDFAERTRTYSFLVTLLVMVWATNVFIPAAGANYSTVNIDGHRGFYNSHWLGVQLAMLVNTFFGLIGFYLVKNAVDRDRRTGVGELLAASPLSRFDYTLSKWLSNFFVLASMLTVVAVCTALLQLVRGEDRAIDPIALLTPLVLIVLPFFALVAAVAVLFEVLPIARGGLGNVAYFFLWTFGGIAGAIGGSRLVARNDPMGIGVITPQLIAATSRAFPSESITGKRTSLGIHIGGTGAEPIVPFHFHGMEWTLETVMWRVGWLLVALLIAAAAAVPFDRFAGEGFSIRGALGMRPKANRAGGATIVNADALAPVTSAVPTTFNPRRLAATPPVWRFDLLALVRAELTIAFKSYPKPWFVGAIGLAIASLVAPLPAVKAGVAPMLAIWPMLLWSALGTRESRAGTSDLLFSAPRPLSRQLPATWLAGVAIALATSALFGVRLLLASDFAGALTWLVGVAFVPAFALGCGVLTGNSRLFEGLYLGLWYVGALNHVPALDFTGATAASAGFQAAAIYAPLTALCLATAWAARKRQLST